MDTSRSRCEPRSHETTARARSKATGRSDLDRNRNALSKRHTGPAVLQHPRGNARGAAAFLPEWNRLRRSDQTGFARRSIALSKEFACGRTKRHLPTVRQALSPMSTTPQIRYLANSSGDSEAESGSVVEADDDYGCVSATWFE